MSHFGPAEMSGAVDLAHLEVKTPQAIAASLTGVHRSVAGKHTVELVEQAVQSLRDRDCHHDRLKLVASVGVIPHLAPSLTVYQRMEAVCDACKLVGHAAVPLDEA